ncbi:hypothetical protein JAAARDRAFT_28401 [Jaapia argillacea MUCL 33604]|uniref:Uncharacterized protein n=1 Tax=Jaapia argillacea MUCL 33604 TaxID=933084 RepID=A0A067QMK5_9AGAM|nr:hypothetical protein JAAARDRAFT_28401 [Jaapia argillacea MUCL 33604]
MAGPLAPANNKANTAHNDVKKPPVHKEKPLPEPKPSKKEKEGVAPVQQQHSKYPPEFSKQPTPSPPSRQKQTQGAPQASASQPQASQQQQQQQPQTKKVSRRSSKPIINWFQRKLAGTVRPRRASESARLAGKNQTARRNGSLKRIPSTPSLPTTRTSQAGSGVGRQGSRTGGGGLWRPNTISLNGDDEFDGGYAYGMRGMSSGGGGGGTVDDDGRSSSSWSPSSLANEADEDASVRPLPPSAPPSPSPSRSSSSYLSDPRTFKSMAASTKPTTLLSVDLTGGVAHIAQAPPTPASQMTRFPSHVRSNSGTGITFSALPPSGGAQGVSRPASLSPNTNTNVPSTSRAHIIPGTVHAPQHTYHHPRNNPRPSSPPMDDASMLTLASSAFGVPGSRIGATALTSGGGGAPSTTTGGGGTWSNRGGADSISHFDVDIRTVDSASHFGLGGDEFGFGGDGDNRDVDASVRALRPRSSRRGSWESEASGWSARVGSGGGSVSGGGLAGAVKERERSLWTSYSGRTGGRMSENGDNDGDGDRCSSDESEDGEETREEGEQDIEASSKSRSVTEGEPSTESQPQTSGGSVERTSETPVTHTLSPATTLEPETTPKNLTPTDVDEKDYFTPGDKQVEKKVGEERSSDDALAKDGKAPNGGLHPYGEGNGQVPEFRATSSLSVDGPEIWHSAPSTPMTF